jgi:ferrous iron transport protein B
LDERHAVREAICGNLSAWFERVGVVPWLSGLIVDGIVGGVGAVLGFVPQMLILFFLLSVLEDVGYMARVAFIMDRIFRRFGLSGKSFIPMLISSGCGVPGVMACRTIENERDRRMTIMTTTFVPAEQRCRSSPSSPAPCSAEADGLRPPPTS